MDMLLFLNEEKAFRTGAYFYKKISVDNTSSDILSNTTLKVIKPAAQQGETDSMSTISVMKYIPQTPEGYTYDDDGNLAQDARWEYTWDGENRLVAMQTKAGLTPKLAKRRLEFTYDYMGRRALKKVYEVRDEQTFTSTLISTTKFLYDDWNLIAELDKNNTVKRSYTWGTDISGSMQGAGGVGGLLWMEDHGTSNTYFYLYDGNGNVTSLVDADTGEQVADYDYGPFGEPVKNVSQVEQPFRFSTKYRDEETKLYYYGYRYYNSDTGRWLNRDPIGERGGINIYNFVNNNPIDKWDLLGLSTGEPTDPKNYSHYGLGKPKTDKACNQGETKMYIAILFPESSEEGYGHAAFGFKPDLSDAQGRYPVYRGGEWVPSGSKVKPENWTPNKGNPKKARGAIFALCFGCGDEVAKKRIEDQIKQNDAFTQINNCVSTVRSIVGGCGSNIGLKVPKTYLPYGSSRDGYMKDLINEIKKSKNATFIGTFN